MATVKKKAVKKPAAKVVKKKKPTPKNHAAIVIRGIGNEGWGRTVAFTIDRKGKVVGQVGCQNTSNSWSSLPRTMEKIAKKYGKKSPYYIICEQAVKEIKRRHKSQRVNGGDSSSLETETIYNSIRYAACN